MSTLTYGCIGEHLGHSYSASIHQKLSGDNYQLIELSPDELPRFLEERKFQGINVTIPYKKTVLPYLDHIDALAEQIGAVNTIVCQNGQLYGYNTDAFGLMALFSAHDIHVKGKRILVLGTGGTATMAKVVLGHMGALKVQIVSRTPKGDQIGYERLPGDFSDFDYILNTTPCGMYPHEEDAPLSLEGFRRLSAVVDVIYHPLRTRLLLDAKQRGIKAVGGLYMLVAQAVKASEYFFDRTYPEHTINSLYHAMIKEKRNIVLIGMPSSGKTTLGRAIADKLFMPFYDTDALYTEQYGMPPHESIMHLGEGAFRQREEEILLSVSSCRGGVIATGGGAVLSKRGMEALSRHGVVVWINRPLDELTFTENRPLTATKEDMEKRFLERKPLYEAYADLVTTCKSTLSDSIDDVLQRLQQS